jgi:hypothetical protein
MRAGRVISEVFSSSTRPMLLTGLLLCNMLVSSARSQSPPSIAKVTTVSTAATHKGSPNRVGFDSHAKEFYKLIWGVDSLKVKFVESGEMIRFSYLVLDADKAKQLNDKKANPYLIDERARVSLVIPSLEKVGQLRQSSPPEDGESYWMVFSNKGVVVKPGDRVSIVIGQFRVDGLIVQ